MSTGMQLRIRRVKLEIGIRLGIGLSLIPTVFFNLYLHIYLFHLFMAFHSTLSSFDNIINLINSS